MLVGAYLSSALDLYITFGGDKAAAFFQYGEWYMGFLKREREREREIEREREKERKKERKKEREKEREEKKKLIHYVSMTQQVLLLALRETMH